MCQTRLISDNIVRISTRSYKQRLEAVAPNHFHVSRLSRLNKDLDNFYELLYSQWQTVTEADYKVFGMQLTIMLDTLKELYQTFKKLPEELGLYAEVERLGMNYAAIREVKNDIVNFRIKLPKDAEMRSLMKSASAAVAKTMA